MSRLTLALLVASAITYSACSSGDGGHVASTAGQSQGSDGGQAGVGGASAQGGSGSVGSSGAASGLGGTAAGNGQGAVGGNPGSSGAGGFAQGGGIAGAGVGGAPLNPPTCAGYTDAQHLDTITTIDVCCFVPEAAFVICPPSQGYGGGGVWCAKGASKDDVDLTGGVDVQSTPKGDLWCFLPLDPSARAFFDRHRDVARNESVELVLPFDGLIRRIRRDAGVFG